MSTLVQNSKQITDDLVQQGRKAKQKATCYTCGKQLTDPNDLECYETTGICQFCYYIGSDINDEETCPECRSNLTDTGDSLVCIGCGMTAA